MGEEHASHVVTWRNDPRIRHYFLTSGFTLENQLAWTRALARNNRDFTYAIVRAGNPIGMVGLYDIDPAESSAEFGRVLVDPAYRRQGFGIETTVLVMDFAFDVLKLRCVTANCIAGNTAVLAMFGKLGFVEVSSERHQPSGRLVVHLQRFR